MIFSRRPLLVRIDPVSCQPEHARRWRRLAKKAIAIGKGILMSLQALNTSIDRLTAAVDRVTTLPPPVGGATDEQLAEAAGRVDVQSQRLEALPGSTGGDGATPAEARRNK